MPRWIRTLRMEGELTGAERELLCFIADETRSWDRPCVKASISDLARGAGVSRRWVIKVRDGLIERGLLVQHESGSGYVYGVAGPEEDPQLIRRKVQHRLSTNVDE